MTVAVSDLMYPLGELQAIFFPNKDMQTAVIAWLTEANAKVPTSLSTPDEAVKAWVYYRAYTTVAMRIVGTPASEAYFNQVSRTYKMAQAEMFFTLADKKLAIYRDQTGENVNEIGQDPAETVASQPGTWDFLFTSEHTGFTEG